MLHARRTSESLRRDHFRYVDHPLIYDFRTRRVCIQTGINFYEFVKQIADEMHTQGKLCTGNLGHGPHTQTFFGYLLDKHGGEISYDEPTRHLRGYRMMAHQKPVSHIVYPGTVAARQEETVMHRWLAFGHFPAMSELAYAGRGSDFEKGRLPCHWSEDDILELLQQPSHRAGELHRHLGRSQDAQDFMVPPQECLIARSQWEWDVVSMPADDDCDRGNQARFCDAHRICWWTGADVSSTLSGTRRWLSYAVCRRRKVFRVAACRRY